MLKVTPDWPSANLQWLRKGDNYKNWKAVHHEEIARNIVNAISQALTEYGQPKGYSYSQQFYEDMARGGLHQTASFAVLPASDQQRILNVIAVQLTGVDLNGNQQTKNGTNAGC